MAEGNTDIGNRGLVATLGVLGVIVVGLIIAIVVVGVNKNSQVAVDVPEQAEEEAKQEAEKREYDEYVGSYNSAQERAEGLLNQDPANASAVHELYSQYIDKYIAMGDLTRARALIMAEEEILLSKGLKKEALEYITSIDYSDFVAPERYRIYVEIIRLAQELGDAEVVAKYEPLADEVRAAYEAEYEATKNPNRETLALPSAPVLESEDK